MEDCVLCEVRVKYTYLIIKKYVWGGGRSSNNNISIELFTRNILQGKRQDYIWTATNRLCSFEMCKVQWYEHGAGSGLQKVTRQFRCIVATYRTLLRQVCIS